MPRPYLPAEIRREQILEAATACFGSKGFKATTMADLAKAAGISEARILKLFGTKRGLFHAIADRKAGQRLARPFTDDAVQAGDDTTVLTGIAEALIAATDADPTFLKLMFFSALEHSDVADRFVDVHVNSFIDNVSRYIRTRQRAGAFCDLDPKLTALMFMGMLSTFAQARQLFNLKQFQRTSRKAAVRTAVRLFLHGLVGPE